MASRRINCNFFNFTEPTIGEGKIDELLLNQSELIKSGKVENVKVSGVDFRFTVLEKQRNSPNDPDCWWLGIVEKLDTAEQGVSSNLAGERTVYATGEDEGPVASTGFIYYPKTKTLVLHKKQGGIGDKNFAKFIRRLLKQTGLIDNKIRDFQLELVPDLTKLDRLFNSKRLRSIEYSIAMPENLDSIKQKK